MRFVRARRAFTLIELLVAIAIIGILVALLLPAVQAAREAARKVACNNNLKQLGLALQNYHDVHRTFPSGYLANFVGPNDPVSAETGYGFAWGSLVLPFLEQGNLGGRIQFGRDCRDPVNQPAGATSLEVFRCPSDITQTQFAVDAGGTQVTLGSANYVGIFGYGSVTMHPGNPPGPGVFYRNSKVRIADIYDGTSNTICVGERTHRHKFIADMPAVDASSTWYAAIPGVMRPAGMMMMPSMLEGPGSLVLGHVGQPAMPPMMPMQRTPNTTNHIVHFSSLHPSGVHFVACDGSVRFLSETVEYQVFRSLGERADGRTVGDF